MSEKPQRHPRYHDAAKFRISHPYQVEFFEWGVRLVTHPPRLVERMHAGYPGSASWCDHVNARTFGFTDKENADRFQKQYGGKLVRGK